MDKSKLRSAIQNAINCNSAENGSDTPDFILADYLTMCLEAFDKTLHARSKWYNHHCTIGSCNHSEEKISYGVPIGPEEVRQEAKGKI